MRNSGNFTNFFIRNFLLCIILFVPLTHAFAEVAEGSGHSNVISGVGIAILAATVMAYLGHKLKQPLLLAYIAAGIVIGPVLGFGFIKNSADIETISEFLFAFNKVSMASFKSKRRLGYL